MNQARVEGKICTPLPFRIIITRMQTAKERKMETRAEISSSSPERAFSPTSVSTQQRFRWLQPFLASYYASAGADEKMRLIRSPTMRPISPANAANVREKPASPLRLLRLRSTSNSRCIC
uniref:Uncharacterized protein n=1 Tax=Zea mays TaxID=4577 RepID=B8A0B8_MAIZE|nr:unknown [Zea mays]